MIRAVMKMSTKSEKERKARHALLAFVAALYAQGPQALTFFIEGEAKKFQCGRGVTQGCGLGTASAQGASHSRR